jgi:hypothetical protein
MKSQSNRIALVSNPKDELFPYADPTGFVFYFQIMHALDNAGFEVRKVEKFHLHDIWWIYLLRRDVVLPESPGRARRLFRRLFYANRIPVVRDSIEVSYQGKRLIVAFNWEVGGAGILLKRKPECVTLKSVHRPEPESADELV